MLLTSAPVAIRRVATPMLPLDLHVLSLSLAFILSQDQTLRCVYLVCLFFSEEKGTSATHKPEAVPLRLHALVSLVSMTAVMLSPVTIGILTGDPRNHLSLSLTCLSISSPPAPRRLFSKASKKPLNSEQVLVSRKAMQNYNRSLDCANISATFFQKKAVFLRFPPFRTV